LLTGLLTALRGYPLAAAVLEVTLRMRQK